MDHYHPYPRNISHQSFNTNPIISKAEKEIYKRLDSIRQYEKNRSKYKSIDKGQKNINKEAYPTQMKQSNYHYNLPNNQYSFLKSKIHNSAINQKIFCHSKKKMKQFFQKNYKKDDLYKRINHHCKIDKRLFKENVEIQHGQNRNQRFQSLNRMQQKIKCALERKL